MQSCRHILVGLRLIVTVAIATTTLVLWDRDAAARKYPDIFNQGAMKPTPNTGSLTQWHAMLKRWDDGATCDSPICSDRNWSAILKAIRSAALRRQLDEVQQEINYDSFPYKQDMPNWGVEEFWASPFQFLKKSGDCEDYAIAKFMALKERGVPVEVMRIVIVRDLNLDIGHTVLVVFVDDVPYLLDNQIKSVVEANKVRHYHAVKSTNGLFLWVHGPKKK